MSCCPRDRLCDTCYGGTWDNLRGVAATRGEAWADSVRQRVRDGRPWPPHAGRVAGLALAKVADLTRDPRLRAALAAELGAWAARRWAATSECRT